MASKPSQSNCGYHARERARVRTLVNLSRLGASFCIYTRRKKQKPKIKDMWKN